MGKNKKKSAKEPVPQTPQPSTASPAEAPEGKAGSCEAGALEPAATGVAAAPAPAAPPATAQAPLESRFRRLLPDLAKISLAFLVIGLGAVIWYQPPLLQVSHPYVSYTFEGQPSADAKLYRPLAMPTRFYVELPRQLANRYTWFAVDRRREVAALSAAPRHRIFGRNAIKRSDPLGLDLEFRKLDHSEWQVHFLDDAIVFSNNVLSVRLDIERDNNNGGN
jgi:hypothetical protein